MKNDLASWEHDQLSKRIRDGAVFIYPTDTCYGLGCSIDSPEAIDAVFDIKGRDESKTVPVLLTADQVKTLAAVCPVEERAMERFWPGGLTLALDARNPDSLDPRLLREGTVAVREPDVAPLIELIEEAGPIVGTSANLSGRPSPGSLDDIHPGLFREVDFILGEREGTGESSTVAQWDSESSQWIIHREGPVSREELEKSKV